MPNHVHMIFRSISEDPSGLIRDFKGFTSKKLIETIKENSQEGRKEFLLNTFAKAGANKSNIEKYQFWQHDNMPIELYNINLSLINPNAHS